MKDEQEFTRRIGGPTAGAKVERLQAHGVFWSQRTRCLPGWRAEIAGRGLDKAAWARPWAWLVGKSGPISRTPSCPALMQGALAAKFDSHWRGDSRPVESLSCVPAEARGCEERADLEAGLALISNWVFIPDKMMLGKIPFMPPEATRWPQTPPRLTTHRHAQTHTDT